MPWLTRELNRKKAKRKVYLELARELKKLKETKVTIIPTEIGAFGAITKGLVQRLEDFKIRGRVETI